MYILTQRTKNTAGYTAGGDRQLDLYASSKDPVPWSCRVRAVFTRGDRITTIALNSLSPLRHIKRMHVDIKNFLFVLPSQLKARLCNSGLLPGSEADLKTLTVAVELLGPEKAKVWSHFEHMEVHFIWLCAHTRAHGSVPAHMIHGGLSVHDFAWTLLM